MVSAVHGEVYLGLGSLLASHTHRLLLQFSILEGLTLPQCRKVNSGYFCIFFSGLSCISLGPQPKIHPCDVRKTYPICI